jgi:hypothetical protein
MRVEIINNEKDDSREMPTKFVALNENKRFHFDNREHYGSDWFCEVEPSEFGDFLVGIQKHEDSYIGFNMTSDGEMMVWIGIEDAEWG